MDPVQQALERIGYQSLWDWLDDHPGSDWVGVGEALGVVPIAAIRRALHEAPSRGAAVRQCLYRWFQHLFPEGWEPEDDFARAGLYARLRTYFQATPKTDLEALMSRLAGLPVGWMPMSHDDPEMLGLTKGLFDTIDP